MFHVLLSPRASIPGFHLPSAFEGERSAGIAWFIHSLSVLYSLLLDYRKQLKIIRFQIKKPEFRLESFAHKRYTIFSLTSLMIKKLLNISFFGV